MSVINKKGPIIDPGKCRCCGATKKCRLLNVEYEFFGQKEVYSDLFVDTFGLMLSHLDTEPEERLICATCVTRLRDAGAFRRQVLQCEEQLLKAKIQVHDDDTNTEVKEEDLKDPAPQLLEDNHYSDNSDDMDYEPPLSELVKESKKKSPKKVGRKEKKSKRTKKVKAKEKIKAKREMLDSLREMEKQYEQMQETEIEQVIRAERPPKKTEQKSFENTIIIVENSYVCPFETSYSDYYCIYCRETFTDPDKLRLHTLNHDPTTFKDIIIHKKIAQIDITKVNCRLCNELIENFEDLKNHLTEAHGKSFSTEDNEYLKFKLTANNLTCLECGGVHKYFHALKKHMAEHFGTCICDVCGAHYFEERMLSIHQKTHIKIDQDFPCKDCGKIFKSKHSRYLHETKTHKKEPTYLCSKCDEVFFSYSLRYRHMIDVHGEERLYQCDHCDRSYDSRKSLREHNRRFHLKLFKHQCDLCDKRFYLPSRLKEHMSTHTGERNFRCEYCGKSYPRFRGLKVHMQSHSNEKKYRCPLCNGSFTQNVNLKNHMKRQHNS